ncbi:Creatinase/aminopeptidase [Jimgerdemannia flammicorona]|uniref:Creatinase/aminopeptidase n=1 Tax=Jimgerdemannia flammicorona TaxID=994334 RepID=A0A433QBQ1_9FUNG|nr:Creatinase/aminopeptidase [Jimgerdemannia flammicorona]
MPPPPPPPPERTPLLHKPNTNRTLCYSLLFVFLLFCLLAYCTTFDGIHPRTNPSFSHLHNFCADIQPILAAEYLTRQVRLAQTLTHLNATAFIAEPGPSMSYYTNVKWSLSERPFLAIIRPDSLALSRVNITFVSPAFEVARARENIKHAGLLEPVGIVEWEEHLSPYDTVAKLLASTTSSPATVYLDTTLRFFIASALTNILAPLDIATSVSDPEIVTLRSIKSSAEIDIMRCANMATVEALRAVKSLVKPGATEDQIAAWTFRALEAAGLRKTWVLALVDDNAAYPHGEPGKNKKVGEDGGMVLIDAGGSLFDYESDITRTFFVPPTGSNLNMNATRLLAWHAVHAAQERALSTIRVGVACSSVDLAARDSLVTAGLANYFTHRLGHGIGMEGHEHPFLNKGNTETRLEPGMTFSVEPGVYVMGEFGIRLEDIVVVTSDGEGVELLSGGLAKGPFEF